MSKFAQFSATYGGMVATFTSLLVGTGIIFQFGRDFNNFQIRLEKYDKSIEKLDLSVEKLDKTILRIDQRMNGEEQQRTNSLVRAFANLRYHDSRIIQLQRWANRSFDEEELFKIAQNEKDADYDPKNRWYEMEKLRGAHRCLKPGCDE